MLGYNIECVLFGLNHLSNILCISWMCYVIYVLHTFHYHYHNREHEHVCNSGNSAERILESCGGVEPRPL